MDRLPDPERGIGDRQSAGALMKSVFPLLALYLAFSAPPLRAAPTDGLAIFREALARDSGYRDFRADITMLLREKSGRESRRVMEIAGLERIQDGAKTLLRFANPPDVKGTALLTHVHKSGPDEQWIYLPAFKKARKISDANKTSPFMGSEFSYEDINSLDIQLEKFAFTYLRAEDLGGLGCVVVERVPAYANSGYSRQIVWLDTAEYQIRKVEYFDDKGAHVKTLSVGDYEKFLGRFWRSRRMTMANHRNGNTTFLEWSGYTFRNGMREGDFDLSSLKR